MRSRKFRLDLSERKKKIIALRGRKSLWQRGLHY